ncbi:MAG TPA: hypothetical protein DCW90_09510 [Lachnospiraceae bacterium]|nr:hypothetical protein [Lachnospiraceae bacterium]
MTNIELLVREIGQEEILKSADLPTEFKTPQKKYFFARGSGVSCRNARAVLSRIMDDIYYEVLHNKKL